MFRNITLGIVFASVLAVSVGVSPASALTIDELQAQIRDLMAKIADLVKQRDEMVSQQPPPGAETSFVASGRLHRICGILNRNLAQGSEGDDVRGLQEFLQSEGYLLVTPTGFFGSLTAQAVAKWQTAQGVDAVGRFGPISRERLKIWCGGGGWENKERFSATPTRGEAPLAVTFSTWLSGFRVNTISYTIDFGDGTSERAADCPAPADACTGPGMNTHTYTQNGTYTATLNRIIDPCAGQPACRAAVHSEVVAKAVIAVGGPQACTKEYKPVCGSKQVVCITTPCNPIQQTYSNRCMMEADGATLLYEGQCRDNYDPAADRRCKSWFDGCNTCSRETQDGVAMCTLRACFAPGPRYCTAWFDNTGNKPPVVAGFSGPTTLNVNQTGTWTINASDPENGQLSYRIDWGDSRESPFSALIDLAGAIGFVQTTTFTHAYASAGTYVVSVVVRDNAGQEARTSTTVKVGTDVPVACTLEYNPVCGQPPWACPDGMYCATVMPAQQTYSNRCFMNAASATFVHEGVCQSTTIACPADAMQCPNGQWVGRTGPNCQFACPGSTSSNTCTYAGQQYEEGGTYTTRTSCPSTGSQYDYLATCSATFVCRGGSWAQTNSSSEPTLGGSCRTPWGNKIAVNGEWVAEQPYFSNGLFSGTVYVPLWYKCQNGSWGAYSCAWNDASHSRCESVPYAH